ncbi:MAG: glutathione S-transferase family protein [Dongiaceae bacterium]
MGLQLYDLAGADSACRFSPYCWRIRMALAHKRLPVETIPWRFTDKEAIAASGQGRVPVLVHDGKWLAESWDIASYLEDTYPGHPSLFGGPAGRGTSRYFSVLGDVLVTSIFPFIARDIIDRLEGENQAYYRRSREERLGMTLEAFVAGRDARLPALRDSLAPLRLTLKRQPFLGGEQPLYADYAVFGTFQWARCVSPFMLLAEDDPLRAWRDRLLDAYDGLARQVPAFDS